ncbi:MAG: glycosyltransferase [Bacteroidetes bacterium]|nr:glycosyltransferase [Bacteroidota bacterium]
MIITALANLSFGRIGKTVPSFSNLPCGLISGHYPVSFKASIIISVYNNLEFLKLVLAGFERQTEKDFELIISDDGSGKAFQDGLMELMAHSSLTIRHNWHPDDGFRKNKILNSSVVKAQSDYLIFVDGDCIPHAEFVSEHLQESIPGYCLVGRRVDLSSGITQALLKKKIQLSTLETFSGKMLLLKDYLFHNLQNWKNGIYFKSTIIRKFLNRADRGLLGANFSLFKKDLLLINGFDERYTAPTFGEDTDVEFRLRLAGIKMKPILSIAVLYHCHHKLLPRPRESELQFEIAQKENKAATDYGIKAK